MGKTERNTKATNKQTLGKIYLTYFPLNDSLNIQGVNSRDKKSPKPWFFVYLKQSITHTHARTHTYIQCEGGRERERERSVMHKLIYRIYYEKSQIKNI